MNLTLLVEILSPAKRLLKKTKTFMVEVLRKMQTELELLLH